MRATAPRTPHPAVRTISLAISLLGIAGSAHAFTIDTGNPDLSVVFDNTVRYTAGVRTDERNSKLAKVQSSDEGNAKFDTGELVANRLDLLSELDIVYKRDHGFRISAAGWYDHAYDDTSVHTVIPGSATSYRGNKYSNYTERFYKGPSGEILDAFAFTRFDISGVPTRLKVGRHAITWGEGFLFGAHAISFAQSPSDGAKGAANPGSETKELALPVGQLSFQTQLTDTLSMAGQYFYDWKPNRSPEGGTFLGNTDFLGEGPNQQPVGTTGRFRPRLDDLDPDKKSGNWGLNLRYVSDLLGANVGAYYRELDERSGWLQTLGAPAPGFYRIIYPENTKLYGLSFSKVIAEASVGMDLSYRKNTALNSSASIPTSINEGARGNTWHMTLGMQKGFTQNALFDSATLIAELAYSQLDKVTKNEQLYRGVGRAACTNIANVAGAGDKWNGCSTKEVWQLGMRFLPQWQQVAPGVDLTVPIALTYGLSGNGATLGGGNEGAYSYSIGLQLDINQKHQVVLQYADSYAKYDIVPGNALGTVYNASGNGGFALNDRGRVTLTLKTSF